MKGCFGCLVRTLFALLLLMMLGLLGIYFFILPDLSRTLEDSIRRQFILAPSSTVVVSRGSLLDTLEGEVESVLVEADEAKLDGLLVRDFRLRAEGIRFDVLRTVLSQRAEFTQFTHGEVFFSVTEAALLDRWAPDLKRRGFSNVELTLADPVVISADFDLRVTKIDVLVTGWIEIEDDNRIRFTADEIDVEGTKIGLDEVKASVSSLAPIVDLGRLKLDLMVEKLEIGDGVLRIGARTRGLDDRLAGTRKMKAEFELQEQAGKSHEEDLLAQIRGLLDLDGEERKQQLDLVLDKLRESGIKTRKQLAEFSGRQLDSLGGEYQSILKELNRLIESQIEDKPDGAVDGDAEADSGQDHGAGE